MHGSRPLRETPLTMLGLLQHLCIIKGRIPSDIINMWGKNSSDLSCLICSFYSLIIVLTAFVMSHKEGRI